MSIMLLAPILAVAISVAQQPTGPTTAELTAMKKLGFLVGKWEGQGWMQQGPTKETANGTENVQWKLQGKALLVEGLFTHVSTKQVVHETLAVITFDEKSGKYKFSAFLFNRPNGEYELKAHENGFTWSMKPTEQVTVDFAMNLVNGEWIEVGEFSFNGGAKTKFLEMKLKKVQ